MEENKEQNITNKVVIVTGGSRGIGRQKQAKQIQEELKKQGKNIEIFKADVSKREEVKKLIQFTLEKYKTIDILINNAGIAEEKLFTDITDDDWNRMLQVNLTSVFYCIQETLPTMINKKDGCIINISSIWGQTGGSCEVHYSVSKAGIDGMTKALAKELGASNIRINSIAPGAIDTEMNKNVTQEEWNELKKEIPLQKIGKPIHIAKCVKWIIEDEYTTGQVIAINGGWYI